MKDLKERAKRDRRAHRGQGMTEYIIIVAVIAILSIAVVMKFGNQIRELFFKSGEALSSGTSDLSIEKKMDSGDVEKSGF